MRIRVQGHSPLNGVYRPSGSANAAQALLAAALLTEHPVTLHNMPRNLSTASMIDAAAALGAALDWHGESALVVKSVPSLRRVLTQDETDATIGALLFVPPLLVQRQHVRLEIDFSLNRIRTHLEALRDLGIDVVAGHQAVEFKAAAWDEKEILLTQASVTATSMVMMLAARLGKKTTIHNAACEPHVQELARMLTLMGAPVEGIGSNVICVRGAPELSGAEVSIRPDHIETASVAAIAAMCGGRVQFEHIHQHDLRMIAKIFWRLGIQTDLDAETLFIPRHESLTVSNREEDVDSSIETAPWPGFPSDLVSVATVIATQARGTSLIHEKMFSNRLLFVDKLKAMGAQIVLCDPHRAIVIGHTPLRGIYMDSPDVRAGIGMLAAALVAEGESVIDNAQVLEHTFAGVLDKLRGLNAHITIE
ncbi:MAG: UDP-N-acetylglucosamine 1-carboxyvinyltransferase [bacterium]|nr:UDP-N-acetylglucosamine 1-carboxyvinyltransferase [bacterium]